MFASLGKWVTLPWLQASQKRCYWSRVLGLFSSELTSCCSSPAQTLAPHSLKCSVGWYTSLHPQPLDRSSLRWGHRFPAASWLLNTSGLHPIVALVVMMVTMNSGSLWLSLHTFSTPVSPLSPSIPSSSHYHLFFLFFWCTVHSFKSLSLISLPDLSYGLIKGDLLCNDKSDLI